MYLFQSESHFVLSDYNQTKVRKYRHIIYFPQIIFKWFVSSLYRHFNMESSSMVDNVQNKFLFITANHTSALIKHHFTNYKHLGSINKHNKFCFIILFR